MVVNIDELSDHMGASISEQEETGIT